MNDDGSAPQAILKIRLSRINALFFRFYAFSRDCYSSCAGIAAAPARSRKSGTLFPVDSPSLPLAVIPTDCVSDLLKRLGLLHFFSSLAIHVVWVSARPTTSERRGTGHEGYPSLFVSPFSLSSNTDR